MQEDISRGIVQSISLFVPDGKDVRLVDTSKRKIPNFYMMGNGKMNKHGLVAIDLLVELETLGKASLFVINTIKRKLSYDNATGIAYVPMKDLSEPQVRQFKQGFKELKSRDLVKRISMSHYMINPNAIIPMDYDEAVKIWINSN